MDTLTVVSFEETLRKDADLLRALDHLEYDIHYVSGSDYLSSFQPRVLHSRQQLFLMDQYHINNDHFRDGFSSILNASHGTINFCLIQHADCVVDNAFMDQFHDFLFWPCCASEFKSRLQRFRGKTRNTHPDGDIEHLVNQFSCLNLIGKSRQFIKTLTLISKVSDCEAPVLIQGETGTGKENAARAIHYLSNRADHGFVPINCGALPDELLESELFGHERGAFTDAKQRQQGLVEIARGGTLFLDEVDSLSAKAQAALLRFLQTQEYRPVGSKVTQHSNVRILSACNCDLSVRVANKTFREDLLFRLNVLNVTMPPLRERQDDIPRIAQSLLFKFAQQHNAAPKQLSRQSLSWLMRQPWPGNVRELENVLLRETLLADGPLLQFGEKASSAFPDDTPIEGYLDTGISFQEAKLLAINQFEKEYLQAILRKASGNVSEAARLAGKERRALGKLLKKYNIDRRRFVDQCLVDEDPRNSST